MILGMHKEQVIANIKEAANAGDFYRKVEVDDPELTPAQKKELLEKFVRDRKKLKYRLRCWGARHFVNIITAWLNRNTEIVGLENVKGIKGGAIITSNHFNPIDITVPRKFTLRRGTRKMYIVSQETNLAMTGFIGFIIKYTDTIPISANRSYMETYFPKLIQKLLKKKRYILIYPEQEMWFNYRKPRPPKRGAYFYAAQFGVPVISCFVEMIDRTEKETEQFYRVDYVLHILPAIYPDPALSPRENSRIMMETDYRQKREAYEAAYGKKLDYHFEDSDIAGWISPEKELTEG